MHSRVTGRVCPLLVEQSKLWCNGLTYFYRWDHMKISYDSEVDALSITFRETIVTTKHLGEGIAADYDADEK